MATDPGDSEPFIRQAILERMRRAPRLADTLEGIANWWLPQVNIEVPPEHVERLLRKLVAEGILVAHTLPDGTELYSSPEPVSARNHTPEPRDDVSGHTRYK